MIMRKDEADAVKKDMSQFFICPECRTTIQGTHALRSHWEECEYKEELHKKYASFSRFKTAAIRAFSRNPIIFTHRKKRKAKVPQFEKHRAKTETYFNLSSDGTRERFDKHLLACPKCKGTTFYVYAVTAKAFNKAIVQILKQGRPDMTFLMHKCTQCGWETHVLDFQSMEQVIQNMLFLASIPRRKDQICYAKAMGMDEHSFVLAK
jgi:hypothetical protein